MSLDLANFYLNTTLNQLEYARIHLSVIPQEVIDKYNLTPYAYNGYIYFELGKGMYGLKQAGKLPTTSSPLNYLVMVTTNAAPRQASGDTNGNQSRLSLLWKTLEYNTLVSNMPNT